MNKQDFARVITILETQYLRGGTAAKEAKEIIILLLGKEHGQELIRLWDNLLMSN